MQPRFPDVEVHLHEQRDKPVACIALVRRSLQKAGHTDAAARFTEEAMAGEIDDIFTVAARYVQLR